MYNILLDAVPCRSTSYPFPYALGVIGFDVCFSKLVMFFNVSFGVCVRVLQEKGFEDDVSCKCHRRNAESWKCSLEAIPSGKGSGVPPGLAVPCKPCMFMSCSAKGSLTLFSKDLVRAIRYWSTRPQIASC